MIAEMKFLFHKSPQSNLLSFIDFVVSRARRWWDPLSESEVICSLGWELYQSSSDQPLLHGREYFVDHNEVVTYVAKHQNNSCSDAALKNTFPRRSLAGSSKREQEKIRNEGNSHSTEVFGGGGRGSISSRDRDKAMIFKENREGEGEEERG
jgi:hypothetical protein